MEVADGERERERERERRREGGHPVAAHAISVMVRRGVLLNVCVEWKWEKERGRAG